MSDHPLPKPPFTDRERAAYDWLLARRYWKDVPWRFVGNTKEVQTNRDTYPDIIALAQHLGWEG